MLTALIMDIAMSVLLAVTIYYCWKLNNYIKMLKDSRGELSRVIKEFDEATGRAQSAIAELKDGSKKAVDKLQVKIEKAEFLADDLSFMIDKATKRATRLGQEISEQKRVEARTGKTDGTGSPSLPTKDGSSNALAPVKKSPIASVGAGLEKLASKAPLIKRDDKPKTESSTGGKTPTKAELALMEALKSIR